MLNTTKIIIKSTLIGSLVFAYPSVLLSASNIAAVPSAEPFTTKQSVGLVTVVGQSSVSDDVAQLISSRCVNQGSQSVGALLPLMRNAPEYPEIAKEYALEGWVELRFSVKADGTTDEVIVTNASTGTIFDDAAYQAVKKYRYCPGVAADNQAIRIRFQINTPATL